MDKKESLKQAFSIKFDINNLMEFHYSTGKFVGLIWIFCGFLFFLLVRNQNQCNSFRCNRFNTNWDTKDY
jgi:hypothetical protein